MLAEVDSKASEYFQSCHEVFKKNLKLTRRIPKISEVVPKIYEEFWILPEVVRRRTLDSLGHNSWLIGTSDALIVFKTARAIGRVQNEPINHEMYENIVRFFINIIINKITIGTVERYYSSVRIQNTAGKLLKPS